ncbi:hypothetical protein WMY93_007172 [Mugilogobius chulae]|uniref:glutathione transferase n=1 Tax=Mugilogobius chulae TaxID=88201 RepID=A0AAW0PPG8_9GOBI
MESIRWVLAAANVPFEEVFLTTHAQYLKLIEDEALMFQQVPLVEMDGMKLVQTKAILQYIAEKYHLHGKDLKEKVIGIIDLMEMMMILPFAGDPKAKLENIEKKSIERYLPVFEKALAGGQNYLVGGKMTFADVLLLECTLMLEEKFATILSNFPNVKAFQGKMTKIQAISNFLKPGSQRKPLPDENYVKTVMEVFALSKMPPM